MREKLFRFVSVCGRANWAEMTKLKGCQYISEVQSQETEDGNDAYSPAIQCRT